VLENWLREIRKQGRYYGLTSAKDSVSFGSAHLSGYALDWWDSLTDGERATASTSFSTFEATLRARFQPITTSDSARQQLDSLRQGAKQSVHDYISSFRRCITALPHMQEGDKVHAFLRGLLPATQRDLRKDGVATLDEAIIKAARIGSMDQFSARSAAAAAYQQGGGNHMDLSELDLNSIEGLEPETDDEDAAVTRGDLLKLLNAMKEHRSNNGNGAGKRAPFGRGSRHSSRVPGLTAEQVRERLDGGLCFLCGEAGHRKFECPTKKHSTN